MERKDELEAQVRKTSLRERLDECRTRIGKMCSEGRPPRMCIPVQWDDDDFYISTTLADAQRALDALQAQLARWKEALGEWLWNCTNLLGDYHIKTVQDFNEEVNRRIAWLMQHLDHTLPPPMTDEERDRMRKLSEDNAALQADNECKDSLIETLQAQLRQVLEVEHKYRKELWLGHRHHGMYGDDGEMQCIECHPYGVTDYKRDPLDKVEHAAFQARIHRAAQIEEGE